MPPARPAFPVAESTLASDALAQLVQYRYDLAAPVRCTFIKRGTNDTYLIADAAGKKAILRVYPNGWRTREQIEEELEILEQLHSKSAPVSYAMRSRDGERMQTVTAPEGERHLALFKYAEGDFGPFDDPHLFALGTSLAEIHVHSNDMTIAKCRPLLDVPNLLHDSLSWIKQGGGGSDVAFLREVAQRLERAVQSLPRTAPDFGLCHGDFGGFNTHVDADGHQCHFDFDFCGIGWRAYDLAVFLWSRHKIAGLTEAPKHFAKFMQGYESVRPISDAERRSIPYFVACREIFIMGVSLRNLNRFPRRPSEDPVAGCVQFLKRWIDEQHLDL